MSLLKSWLAAIPDPRRAQGRRYDLPHGLLFSILAVASGASSYRKIPPFLATPWQRLNTAFGGHWPRAPASTSIRYALQGLDADEVEQAFRPPASALAGEPTTDLPCRALDGKTRRGRLDRFEDQKAPQILSALAADTRLVRGHLLLEDADKDHEIQALQRRIEALGLTGHRYTLDALPLQKTPSNRPLTPPIPYACN